MNFTENLADSKVHHCYFQIEDCLDHFGSCHQTQGCSAAIVRQNYHFVVEGQFPLVVEEGVVKVEIVKVVMGFTAASFVVAGSIGSRLKEA